MADQRKITQCPECQTAFRVSDAQLATARGAVRCGSCLQVFLAKEHWIQLPTVEEDDPDDWEDPFDHPHIASHDGDLHDLAEEIEDDEAWVLDLLREADLPIPDDLSEHLKLKKTASSRTSQPEFAFEAESEPEPEPEPESDSELETEAEAVAEAKPESIVDTEMPAAELSPPPSAAITAASLEQNDHNDIDLQSVTAEPIEFELQDRKPSAWRWLFWPLVIVAALALAAQLAWYERADLSRKPEYRPLYVKACQLLKCQLPPQLDLTQLSATDLVVREHPSYENAIIVDLMLTNNAQYPQHWPGVYLSFTDSQGGLVAERAFQPKDYLVGEVAGSTEMAPAIPVHVSLELMSPGDNATGFQIDLRLPSTSVEN
ncbi:MAG: DUF3426 domain-containing protein [Pseudomonadales bacterium]